MSGVISDNGQGFTLAKVGAVEAGALLLTGANIYSGGIPIWAGVRPEKGGT